MNKRTGIAVEVNRLFRVKQHILPRIDLQDKVLECAKAYLACNLVLLFLCDTREAKHLVFAHLLGVCNHLRHQVVGIHNGTFAALHLAVGQFYHAVREMYEFLTEGETKSIEKDREDLKMILLLVAHYIYHLIDGIVLKTQLSRTDILRHIDRGAIASE